MEEACCLCGKGGAEVSTWCRTCGRGAHPRCMGLVEREDLAASFRCHRCLAGESDLSLAAPEEEQKMKAIMAEIEAGCRDGLEKSSQSAYRSRMEFVWKYAEGAFPGNPQTTRKALRQRKSLPSWVVLGALLARAKTGAKASVEGLAAAINKYHERKGTKGVLKSALGREVLRAAKKKARKGRGAKAPLPKTMLAYLLAYLETKAERSKDREKAALHRRNAAWLATGFCALLRKSELCALQRRDITHREEEGVWVIHVRRSKTDPQGIGAYITVADSTSSGLELGATMRAYLKDRDRLLGSKGELPLFPAWDFEARSLGKAPLDGKGAALARALKKILKDSNKEMGSAFDVSIFSTHSLRRGGATAMSQAGVPPDLIQQHGRWTSDCYKRYIERAVSQRREATWRL